MRTNCSYKHPFSGRSGIVFRGCFNSSRQLESGNPADAGSFLQLSCGLFLLRWWPGDLILGWVQFAGGGFVFFPGATACRN
jgi:hypothetical protein